MVIDALVDTSVYVHFPWCARKCPYCDFATTARAQNDIPHADYASAVIDELSLRGPFKKRRLKSVFFGGGTPSLWDTSEIARVLSAIKSAFLEHDAELEVTSECNPASLSTTVIHGMKQAGVNRLSIGVQSLKDRQLAYLGRLHDQQMALDVLAEATHVFSRVSADLMFGMPRQAEIEGEIDAIVATGVSHVSAYALTIEPGTLFGSLARAGKLEVSGDDQYAGLFVEAERAFSERGFEHYEISNYARAGEHSRHNAHYWTGGDYLGLGAAAVGALSRGTHARRYKNLLDAEKYMARPLEAEEAEELTPQMRVQEAFMLGLRTCEGVDLRALSEKTGIDPLEGREVALEKRLTAGDLKLEGERLTVPRPRWILLDGIVADLF